MVVTLSRFQSVGQNKKRKRRRKRSKGEQWKKTLGRSVRMVPDPVCPGDQFCSVKQVGVCCSAQSSSFE